MRSSRVTLWSLIGLLAILAAWGLATKPAPVPEITAPLQVEGQVTEEWKDVTATIQEGYYLQDNEDKSLGIVKVNGFVSYEVTLYPQAGDFSRITSLFEKPVEMVYCGKECTAISTSEGDPVKIEYAKKHMKLYLLLEDGTYAELAFYPPEPPKCIILGVHFEVNDLYVSFQDFDGEQKLNLRRISPDGTAIEEIEELPYAEPNFEFKAHDFSSISGGFAALIGQDTVTVFTPDDQILKVFSPCVAG